MNEPVTDEEEETARRRDEALQRALKTPPQPKPSPNQKIVKPVASSIAGKRKPTASGSYTKSC